MAFKRAEKKNAKLRLAISGVSGGGKSYSALLFAKEFGSKIAVLDSERGSASLYADLVPFDVEELEETSIQTYLAKIADAAEAGYDVLVIDSYSHSWLSALEAVDRSGGWARGGKNISPLISRLVTAMLSFPGHVIATMRAKTDYAVETNDAGKVTGMKKLGVGPVVRADTEYEFTVWLDVTREGAITVSKTRCSALDGQIYRRDTDIPRIAGVIKGWLNSGAETTAADKLRDALKFIQTDEGLEKLAGKIKAALDAGKLTKDEWASVKPAYAAKKRELAASAPTADANDE